MRCADAPVAHSGAGVPDAPAARRRAGPTGGAGRPEGEKGRTDRRRAWQYFRAAACVDVGNHQRDRRDHRSAFVGFARHGDFHRCRWRRRLDRNRYPRRPVRAIARRYCPARGQRRGCRAGRRHLPLVGEAEPGAAFRHRHADHQRQRVRALPLVRRPSDARQGRRNSFGHPADADFDGCQSGPGGYRGQQAGSHRGHARGCRRICRNYGRSGTGALSDGLRPPVDHRTECTRGAVRCTRRRCRGDRA